MAVQDAVSKRDAIAAKLSAANALLLEAAALGFDFDAAIGAKDLSPSQLSQLQAWIGSRGTHRAWEEVYRASRHGFSAAAFHGAVDGKARLLVLVREKAKGLLFGGFTPVGFRGGSAQWITDAGAFLYSLDSGLGVPPAKFASNSTGHSVYSDARYGPTFGGGHDLYICSNADSNAGSNTSLGNGYAAPSAGGVHVMSGGVQTGWLVSEIVAWVIPQ